MPINRFIMYLLILAELGLVGLTLVVALVWPVIGACMFIGGVRHRDGDVVWRGRACCCSFDHYVDAGLRYVSSRDFFILNTKLGQLSEQLKGGLASSLGTAFLDNLSTI